MRYRLLVAALIATLCIQPDAGAEKRKGSVRCPAVIVDKESGELRKRKDFLCFKRPKFAEKLGFSVEGLPPAPAQGLWSVAGNLVSNSCPVNDPRAITGGSLPIRESGSALLVSSTPGHTPEFTGLRTQRSFELSRHRRTNCDLNQGVALLDDGLNQLHAFFSERRDDQVSVDAEIIGDRIELVTIEDLSSSQPIFKYELRLVCPELSCVVRYEGFASFLTSLPDPEPLPESFD